MDQRGIKSCDEPARKAPAVSCAGSSYPGNEIFKSGATLNPRIPASSRAASAPVAPHDGDMPSAQGTSTEPYYSPLRYVSDADASDGSSPLPSPGLRKQQRRTVKKLVAELEKLQLEGIGSNRSSPVQGARTGSGYVDQLAAGHAQLNQYMDSGLSRAWPGRSFSRSAKIRLARIGGTASVVPSLGLLATGVVTSTAVAAAISPATAVVGALYTSGYELMHAEEDQGFFATAGMGVLAGLVNGAAFPLLSVGRFFFEIGEDAIRWDNRIVGSMSKLSWFERARDYADRSRFSTHEIAACCQARLVEELRRHGRDVRRWDQRGAVASPAPTPATAPSAATAAADRYRAARSGAATSPAITSPAATSPAGNSTWRFPETDANAAAFNMFQARIAGTSEFANLAARPALEKRVDVLVTAMRASPSLREVCFAIAEEGINSCTDRIALALNDMENALVSEKAATGQYSTEELFMAGINFFKLQILDNIALEKINARRRTGKQADEIEMRLVYPTELAYQLNLQGVVRSMEYRRCADVSANDIKAAEDQVRDCMNPVEQVRFLSKWTPWRETMERLHPTAYAPVRRAIAANRDRLSLPPDDITDHQWITALANLAGNEEAQLSAVAEDMTRRWIHKNPEVHAKTKVVSAAKPLRAADTLSSRRRALLFARQG